MIRSRDRMCVVDHDSIIANGFECVFTIQQLFLYIYHQKIDIWYLPSYFRGWLFREGCISRAIAEYCCKGYFDHPNQLNGPSDHQIL